MHIKNDNEAVRIQGTTPFLSFYDNAGTTLKGFVQQYNNNFFLGTPSSNPNGYMQFYLNNLPVMTIRPEGQVVIGSSVSSYSNTALSISQDGSAILGLTANAGRTEIIATHNILLTPQGGFGNVGINTAIPANKLQIGSVGGSNFSTNDFAIGNGTNAMAILQTNASTLIGSTTDMVLRPRNDGTGYVGINVLNPTNKLQIGSVGTTGFSTNDFAIGNGTNAMAIYQTDAATLIGSSTDIILRPRNNGAGRVGINTNNPRAPLDVTDYVARPNSYYSYLNRDAWTLDVRDCQACLPAISIFASNAVFAAEFDAFSDARIKDVTGISDAANDLQTINAIKIADYMMKDKIKYGNRQFKKVIAQEVEKVYPQVVSKHSDFIPNVYQAASKIEKIKEGYRLSFTGNHNISKGAKKLRVLLSESVGMQAYDIIALPSGKQVIINAPAVKTEKAFVYGEEVADFRTVDYEGLTTLNISATQELSKLIKQQQAAIDAQNIKIALLMEEIRLLKEKGSIVKQ